MAGSVRDWRDHLFEVYPDLFHPAGHSPVAQGWPCVGDGWRDLLERACTRIRAVEQSDVGSLTFTQTKEKYGTLRAYWEGTLLREADALVEEAIDRAEAPSVCTCDICGEEGRLYGRDWLTTRCAKHAEGGWPVEFEPRLRNLHTEDRIVGDRRRMRCRRYDRATDSFIDIAPASIGIPGVLR
jgi:hypothetical protein